MPAATPDRHDVTFADASTTPGRRLNNWTATTPPSEFDDENDHYEPGSRWIDTTTGKVYTCVRATVGDAVWTEGGGGGVSIHGDLAGLAADDHTQYPLMVTQAAEPATPSRPQHFWLDTDEDPPVLADGDIPATIARDAEVTAAIATHAATPHGGAATHAGLPDVTADQHHARDHAIDGATHTGTLTDAQIPAGIARDSEVTAAVGAHEGASDPHPGYLTAAEGSAAYEPSGAVSGHAAAGDPHPGYATDGDLTTHAATSHGVTAHSGLSGLTSGDDHTQYQLEAEKGVASGYASLDSGVLVPAAQLATGTPSGSKFLRDDRTWQVPAAGPAANPWDGHIAGAFGDGDPRRLLWFAQLAGTVAATPTAITNAVARISYFRLPADLVLNKIRYYGVGTVGSSVYRCAIYNGDTLARLTSELTFNTTSGAWGAIGASLGLTLSADQLYFIAVAVSTTGTTAGLMCLAPTITGTTGQINVLPKSRPGNLDIDAGYINQGLAQFAVTAGALPTTAATIAAQAAWTGGFPAFWLDNNDA